MGCDGWVDNIDECASMDLRCRACGKTINPNIPVKDEHANCADGSGRVAFDKDETNITGR